MRLLASLIALIALASSALAQLCTPGLLPQRQYPDPPPGVPLLATVKTTYNRVLGDGNTLHGISHVRIARGADGRLLRESYVRCFLGTDDQPHEDLNVFLTDASDYSTIMWSLGEDAPRHAVFTRAVAASPAPPAPPSDPTQRASLLKLPEPTTASLGSRNIQGLDVRGTRITTTLPPESTTNARPIVVTQESWIATNGIVVLQIDDDPRKGRVTLELENLRLGAPDPALFDPPADYLIEDHTPQPHP
jgi:hypothetical protein